MRRTGLTLGALLLLAACASSTEMPGEALAEATAPDAEFSTLTYFDTGLETLNDRCPVRKVPLNPKMEAVYVNGRPIGFC